MFRFFLVLILTVGVSWRAVADDRLASTSELDRVAYAVDGAESSHGRTQAMWRPDPVGPQGPMQVSEKAAMDVGGGNRFDIAQNRAIGRAYLALLHRRYRNWPDAISAYNWGLGRLDLWIRAGRPAETLVAGVAKYVHRVLHDSGLCAGLQPSSECALRDSASAPAFARAGRQQPSAFSRNLAKAEKLAAQFGREAGYVR
jgi:transglycosylase-like protein with SLT domain